ncbi:hypothetical protein [Sphingomonas mucosissima]|uniref:Uncharacterized protein n=1 Tax=Sphingomonas mucosissima TaxID=370959 RepID=A0A245ZMH7_9SPHN|nr:hypothetical protein [Sphingomonas mucosissima]OWK30948.1 hypothetical protein SPMU_19400 [Sphingomonas mucosissima]
MSAASGAQISPGSMLALQRLAAAADDLLVDLQAAIYLYGERTPPKDPSAADDVARYLALVAERVSTNNAELALRGANLLTTVNKGVGDPETSPADRPPTEKAFNVLRAAIAAAQSLRGDVGTHY